MAAGPMKMRATLGQGFTDVRVLMNHPMETGQRKDSDGKMVPMHFIQNLTVKMNGKYNPGAAYYALSTRGVKTSAAFRPETSGIEITRRLLTRDGTPLDGTGAKQGDLLVCEVTVKSTNGALNNVVVQNLIPSGLEVENPRLKSSETFTWITGEMSECTNLDIRDDQVLYFVELGANQPRTFYTLLRAVTPGVYQHPPMFAEAMYSRRNHAVSERGTLVVRQR